MHSSWCIYITTESHQNCHYVCNICTTGFGPQSHAMRILLHIGLDGWCDMAIRIAFAQDWIDGRTQDILILFWICFSLSFIVSKKPLNTWCLFASENEKLCMVWHQFQDAGRLCHVSQCLQKPWALQMSNIFCNCIAYILCASCSLKSCLTHSF